MMIGCAFRPQPTISARIDDLEPLTRHVRPAAVCVRGKTSRAHLDGDNWHVSAVSGTLHFEGSCSTGSCGTVVLAVPSPAEAG